jgi:hypothetical protein
LIYRKIERYNIEDKRRLKEDMSIEVRWREREEETGVGW